MKESIYKNLFLSVDYVKEQTKSGLYTGKTIFYLIGTLPVFLRLASGGKDIVKLKSKVQIQLGDPELKKVLGMKATDPHVSKCYAPQVKAIAEKLEAAVDRIMRNRSFAGKDVADCAVIKMV
jgi:hypothetical protein